MKHPKITIISKLKLNLDDIDSPGKRITKEQYNKEIDTAIKRVRSGKSVSNEQVMNEMDKW